jgi:hypothetical protein
MSHCAALTTLVQQYVQRTDSFQVAGREHADAELSGRARGLERARWAALARSCVAHARRYAVRDLRFPAPDASPPPEREAGWAQAIPGHRGSRVRATRPGRRGSRDNEPTTGNRAPQQRIAGAPRTPASSAQGAGRPVAPTRAAVRHAARPAPQETGSRLGHGTALDGRAGHRGADRDRALGQRSCGSRGDQPTAKTLVGFRPDAPCDGIPTGRSLPRARRESAT